MIPSGLGLWLRRIRPVLSRLGGAMLDLWLPRLCAGCREQWLPSRGGHWCEDCLEDLPWVRSPACPRCGCPFSEGPDAGDHPCGDCILGLPAFDTARSAVAYAGVVRQRIHSLKFGGQLQWVPPLVDLLVQIQCRGGAPEVDVVLPVPLHLRRLRQRGFNQSGLLAGALSRRMGVPVEYDALMRRHWTKPQTRLSRVERLYNVKGAFHVADSTPIVGKRILLIDDVYTTGTTINECAEMLLEAGAERVHALTVARALPRIGTMDPASS